MPSNAMSEEKKKFSFASSEKKFQSQSGIENRFGNSKQLTSVFIPPKPHRPSVTPKGPTKPSKWTIQLELEDFARKLGYHGTHILKDRKWLKSINGPGWQDIEPLPIDHGFTFAKAERFPVPKKNYYAVAGPGSYGINHDPYFKIEVKSRAKGFSHSILPSFEQGTSTRGKSLESHLSIHLPPNLYNLRSPIDELVTKKVSKRGPYDLFTGPRFPEKVPNFTKLYMERIHPSHLNYPKNAFKGKFLRCGMKHQMTTRANLTDIALCKKNPMDPAPNTYHPYPPRPVRHAKYPFDSSAPMARFSSRSNLSPPPGRYNPITTKRIPGDGLRSAFLTSAKRAFYRIEKNSWFE